ncbi:hypothetical protein FNJ84_17700 [Paracoccus sp. M683]|uniref:hypothetical protein n=1 Tax=Paracoccus sp. M683 TaxID=2594268 RepID=UPI00117EFF4C|nr:hypothetical protein [Paracoccus sp. M683]TRW94927.1 hypothetical protein FNJ84_17700 [Paracoccus sp. M683]
MSDSEADRKSGLHLSRQPQYFLLDWARQRCGLGDDLWPRESEAVGVRDADGRVRAVMVLNAFYGDTCTAHIASDHTRVWASRKILAGLFGYTFIYRRMNRMQLIVPVSNKRAVILGVKLGFRPEGVVRAHCANHEDGFLMSMLKHECPFIEDDVMPEELENDHG